MRNREDSKRGEARAIGVRAAESDDVPSFERIVDATELFPSSMLSEMIAPFFASPQGPDIWLAAENGAGVVGVGYCAPERMTSGTWNLLAIGVLPEYQGCGIGAAMMRHLEARLAESGERILLVETMGTPEFEATRRFYRNRGFDEEARIRDFYDSGADKIVFRKPLHTNNERKR